MAVCGLNFAFKSINDLTAVFFYVSVIFIFDII